MSAPDAILARLAQLHPRKIDLSLGRIERLLDALGRPQDRLPPVIHVAGTNGKGSTIAFMRAILEAAGQRVHVYTSPHLVRFNERIRLAGTLASDAQLVAAFEHCERVNEGQSISIFEITTAAALLLFAQHPADVLLLEVGLGGRYDATNVIARPAMTVITPVSMDHVEFLGDSVDKIAFEKAGILKSGAPAVFGPQGPEALAVLEREAARLGVRPLIPAQDYFAHEEHGRLVYEDDNGLIDLPAPKLAGRHQRQNAATAIAAVRHVMSGLPVSAFERGMTSAYWPARLQLLNRGRLAQRAPREAELWLDGGHNEDGGRVIAEAMADFEDKISRPLIVICGMLTTKDASAFLGSFRGLAQEVLAIPVGAEHSGRPASEVAAAARGVGLPAAVNESVEDALALLSARNWPVPPRILVTGSLYLAGDVLKADGVLPD